MQGLLGGLLGGGGRGGRPRPRAAAVAPTLEAHARACASAADLARLLQHWVKLLTVPRDGEALLFEMEGDTGAGAGPGPESLRELLHMQRPPGAGRLPGGAGGGSFADVLLSSGAVEVVCSLCILNEEVRTALLQDDSGAPTVWPQEGGPKSLLELLDSVLRQVLVRQGNTILPVLVGLIGGVQEVHHAARGDQTLLAESVAEGVGQLVANVTQLLKRKSLDRRLEVTEAWLTGLIDIAAVLNRPRDGEAGWEAFLQGLEKTLQGLLEQGELEAMRQGQCELEAMRHGLDLALASDAQYARDLAWNTKLLLVVEQAAGFAEESLSVGNSAFIQGNMWSEDREKQVQVLLRDLGRLATSSRSEEQKVELEARKTATEMDNEAKTLVITAKTLAEKKSEITAEYNKLAAEKLRIAQLMARLSKDISEVVRISASARLSPPLPPPPRPPSSPAHLESCLTPFRCQDRQLGLVQREEQGQRESSEKSAEQANTAKKAAEAFNRQHAKAHETVTRLREMCQCARDLRVGSAETLMMKASSVSDLSAKTRLDLVENRLSLHVGALERLCKRYHHLAEALEPLEAKREDMMKAGMHDVVDELLPMYRKVRAAHEKALSDISDVRRDLDGLVLDEICAEQELVNLDGSGFEGLAGGGRRRRLEDLRAGAVMLLAQVYPEDTLGLRSTKVSH